MAIDNALQIQQQATSRALDTLNNTYGQTRSDLQPYREMGQYGLAGMGTYSDAVSKMNPNISVDFNKMQYDPMYQFARQQAEEMANRRLSSMGMLGSRYGIDALGDVGMRVAQAETDRMYGRQVDNYNRGLNQINAMNQNFGRLATLGQNAATNMANAGAQYAQGYGDLLTGMANAQASGILSQDAFSQQQAADNNAMWAGLAGTALGNLGDIVDGVGSAGSWLKGLGDAGSWFS